MRNILLLALLATLPLTACKRQKEETPPPPAEEEQKAQAPGAAKPAEREGDPAQGGDDEAQGMNPALLEPEKLNEEAPAEYRVAFETTKGDFVVEVQRELAPRGADRFYNLVKNGFYDQAKFFRVVPGFVVQFGIPADPRVAATWRTQTIEDDEVKGSNEKGTITFATAGPNSRTTQVFINYSDNARLDGMGFAPFGKVVEGMDVVENINSEYGERPNQGMIQAQGNAYLEREFPNLDAIKSAKIVE